MTMPTSAEMVATLRRQRPFLLACEAIGWLHMTGKAHPDFLRHHGGAGVKYDPKEWHQGLSPDWSGRLGWIRSVDGVPPLPTTLTDFLAKFDAGSSEKNLVGLLQAGHAMASGIEKNLPGRTSAYLGQDATHLWLASPFGHPSRNLLADPPPLLQPGGWESLLERIGRLLDDLAGLAKTPPADADPWWTWRETAIGATGWLREAFGSTLAETRLPNNDVTLWDQSYVAAALFKAAAAGALLAGASHWQDLKSKTRWRVLTVGFGTRHYEARAVRIGDWAGARREIDAFFDDVRKLVEADLALGALVYRDDETLAFTFPGLRDDATAGDAKGSLDDAAAQALRVEIESEIDELARGRDFETPPLCRLSASTRSFVGVVKELREASAQLAVPVHRAWSLPATEQQTKQQGHVCPVCLVRFNSPGNHDQSDNAKKQRACRICARRRKGGLDAWLAGERDTIWISEVADANDRVALLTFSLDIESWIEGDRIDSLRAQSIADWRRFNPVLGGHDNPIDPARPFESLLEYVESKLGAFDTNDPVLRSLQDGYQHESDWPAFFSKIVEDRADSVQWSAGDAAANARWIVHQLFRKLPSPGRIHRFWRASEAFFDELLDRFRDLASAHPNRWRARRLVLTPDAQSKGAGWEDRETYAGRIGDAPIEVLYREQEGEFVTISNLARCFDAHEAGARLEGQSLELTGDDGIPRTLTVAQAKTPDGLGAYAPVLLLDRSPSRFRVLVPLERANACLEAAIARWRDEFGRVWDRMPLRGGVIAFPRLTPFQAVIEATRNVEEVLAAGACETWRVLEAQTREGVTALSFARDGGGCELVTVPTKLPDGRDDVFYPYVRVEDTQARHARDFRHPAGQVYRHARDLRPGDGVRVDASRVASVFLDTAARRFERVTTRPLADFERMRETWALLVRTAPSLAALHGAWSELAERAAVWRDPGGNWLPGGEAQWADLARAILGQRLAVSGAALDTLVEAARDGILGWAIEWHLALLKERLET